MFDPCILKPVAYHDLSVHIYTCQHGVTLDWEEVRRQLDPPDADVPRALCLFVRMLPQRTMFELDAIQRISETCVHGFYNIKYCPTCSGSHLVPAGLIRLRPTFQECRT